MQDFKSFFKKVDSTLQYDEDELKKGVEVEMEHTTNREIATTIAKQHLAEDPKYYSKLAKIHTEK